MMLPTLHLNGTSQSELYEQLSGACQALREADRALAKATPNGRDYYVQGPQAIYLALSEHEDRRLRLTAVLSELEAILGHVADAEGGR